MRIVVCGATGLSGKLVAKHLASQGHDVLPASRSTGVDLVTGHGVATAFKGADVVIDCSNILTSDGKVSLGFFEPVARNITNEARVADVKHLIVLSIVAVDKTQAEQPGDTYLSGKLRQEQIARESGVPYTILRAAQFFDLIEPMALECGGAIRVPPGSFRPMAVTDLPAKISDVIASGPTNGIVQVVGPRVMTLAQAVGKFTGREVVEDPNAKLLGYLRMGPKALLPEDDIPCITTEETLDEWMRST